jgi:hypothetical protein
MVYYEYWDKTDKMWCLGRMPFLRFVALKFLVWTYGGETAEISDLKRVPKWRIKYKDE